MSSLVAMLLTAELKRGIAGDAIGFVAELTKKFVESSCVCMCDVVINDKIGV